MYSVALFSDVVIKIADAMIWKNYGKTKNLKFLDFALVTDDVIKVFDVVIIFETCDQVIFITYSLKIKRIKFHGFSMKRTGFIVIFLPRAKKPSPPPPFQKLKKARLG